MAIEERDQAVGAVDTRADDEPPAGSPAGPAATESGSLPRLNLDDLRLRLDSPLFARDPGMTPSPTVPRLKELTWDHVVNPASRQSSLTVADEPVADEPATVEPVADEPATVEPVADEPAAVEPVEPLLPPARTIESLLSERTPMPSIVVDPEPAASWHPDQEPEPVATSLTVDEAFLQIVHPEPAPRAPDPVVSGLADLIARATPASDEPVEIEIEPEISPVDEPEPAVEAVVTPEPTLIAPAAEPEPEPAVEAVVTPEAEAEPLIVVAPPVEDRDTPDDPTTVQPVVAAQGAAVEAELNRLAFLPDHEEVAGPVVVPTIATADAPVAPLPTTLALAQHDVYAARTSGGGAHHRRSYADLAAEAAPPAPRKRKRHLFRKLVTMLVLLGMVGGGLFAVKYYVLDARWSSDIEPLVGEVEAARGLTFDHAVDVSTLAAEDYAVELAHRSLGLSSETAEQVGSEWRALGLLSGVNDTRAVGLAAVTDAPAFYDAASEKIYVVDGLAPELRSFALHRALTLALLDQHHGWGDRITDAAPAVARGTRALYDADALAVALSLVDDEERQLVVSQIFELAVSLQAPATPSPFATASSGRLGVAAWPYFRGLAVDERDAVEQDAAVTDGQVFDLRRLTAGTAATTSGTSQGMLFWYHVLASRVDDDLAWRAALGWLGDTLTTSPGATGRCVSATFRSDDGAAAVALQAFEQWAGGAPAQAPASVSSSLVDGVTEIAISACDPGVNVATNDGGQRLSLGGAPLRSEQFRQLLDEQPDLTPGVAACAVYGVDDVSMSDERGVIDGPDGWPAPQAHPAPSIAGCAG